MPTLLEVQNALRKSLVDRADDEAAAMLGKHVPADRLDIYRNTFVIGVTKALRLSYPAVHRLVGDDFFAAAAAIFMARHPPRAAWLDRYGAEFPEFLEQFQPAAALAYLADVARLEWAVSQALHAPDRESLAWTRLDQLEPQDHGRVCFVPHPSVALLRADHPVDAIWRAVLDGDDAALARLDPGAGPVHLLVERCTNGGVEVIRLEEPAWRFAGGLCAGRPLQAALDSAAAIDAPTLLAEHFAAQRFVGFALAPPEGASPEGAA